MLKLIGIRTLVAYICTIGALAFTAWQAPEHLAVIVTALIALFGLLLGKKPDEPKPPEPKDG